MELIILIPAFVAGWRWPGVPRQALIGVYLPVVLLLPHYFSLAFRILPAADLLRRGYSAVGVAMVIRHASLAVDWLDLWVVLFALSAALSEGLNTVMAQRGVAVIC